MSTETTPAGQGRTGDLQRALFVWQMNRAKPQVRPETKERLWADVVRACAMVTDSRLMAEWEAEQRRIWDEKWAQLTAAERNAS